MYQCTKENLNQFRDDTVECQRAYMPSTLHKLFFYLNLCTLYLYIYPYIYSTYCIMVNKNFLIVYRHFSLIYTLLTKACNILSKINLHSVFYTSQKTCHRDFFLVAHHSTVFSIGAFLVTLSTLLAKLCQTLGYLRL